MADADKKNVAAYVSWTTLKNSIDQLSKGEIPNVVDKTVFTGMAFSVQNQLFSGLRFLGLIDEKSRPTKDLEDLAAPDEDARKEKLKQVLHAKYPDLFALNLKKTTPDELGRKMTEVYGVNGETREKAVRFFIGAAQYVGTEISPLLAGKKPNGGSRSQRKRPGRKQQPLVAPLRGTPAQAPVGKTIRLQSGGILTLSATVDLFSLTKEDRVFVFDIIDKLEAYQQPAEVSPEQQKSEATDTAG